MTDDKKTDLKKDKDIEQHSQDALFFVANILSDTKLIMTGGKDEGISENDQFGILGAKNIEIKHPVSNEVLGSIPNIKALLVVDKIYDKYTVLKSKIISNNQTITSKIARMQLDANTPHRAKLNVDPREVKNILSPISGDEIHVGDKVTRVFVED
jgi:hypothetical protein